MLGAICSLISSELQLKQIRLQRKHEQLTGMYMLELGKALSTPRRSKCASCGSREFKEHHGETVCSYCRCEASQESDHE